VPLIDLKFLNELAAGDAGTSNRRHYPRSPPDCPICGQRFAPRGNAARKLCPQV
jgi:hypothetical protein